MAGSLNRVQIIGNVGKDPEIKTFNNGNRVANFSVGMSESWKDKTTGERKEKTEWANVVVLNDGLIKVIESYVKKGSKIFVEGSMQTRKYEKGGADHYTTEVVLQNFGGQIILLGGKSEGGGGGGDYSPAPESGRASGNLRESFPADLDDPIPFISVGVW